MFEKFKAFFDQGKSMLEDAFAEPDDFVTIPEGVTLEQLIEESKQYVDAIIVQKKDKKEGSPSMFLKTGDADSVPDQEIPAPQQEEPDIKKSETEDDTNDR